jgi:Rrf2 family cysteine metabolism transcriptional repressor
MRISKKAQYGLRAMIYLAKKDKEIISLKDIAKAEKISVDFLEKIIKDLHEAGLVKAKKGAFGGYSLARKPKDIYAGEVVEALEDIAPVKCAGCQMARMCSSKSMWDEVRESVNGTLYSKTLKDLIK